MGTVRKLFQIQTCFNHSEANIYIKPGSSTFFLYQIPSKQHKFIYVLHLKPASSGQRPIYLLKDSQGSITLEDIKPLQPEANTRDSCLPIIFGINDSDSLADVTKKITHALRNPHTLQSAREIFDTEQLLNKAESTDRERNADQSFPFPSIPPSHLVPAEKSRHVSFAATDPASERKEGRPLWIVIPDHESQRQSLYAPTADTPSRLSQSSPRVCVVVPPAPLAPMRTLASGGLRKVPTLSSFQHITVAAGAEAVFSPLPTRPLETQTAEIRINEATMAVAEEPAINESFLAQRAFADVAHQSAAYNEVKREWIGEVESSDRTSGSIIPSLLNADFFAAANRSMSPLVLEDEQKAEEKVVTKTTQQLQQNPKHKQKKQIDHLHSSKDKAKSKSKSKLKQKTDYELTFQPVRKSKRKLLPDPESKVSIVAQSMQKAKRKLEIGAIRSQPSNSWIKISAGNTKNISKRIAHLILAQHERQPRLKTVQLARLALSSRLDTETKSEDALPQTLPPPPPPPVVTEPGSMRDPFEQAVADIMERFPPRLFRAKLEELYPDLLAEEADAWRGYKGPLFRFV